MKQWRVVTSLDDGYVIEYSVDGGGHWRAETQLISAGLTVGLNKVRFAALRDAEEWVDRAVAEQHRRLNFKEEVVYGPLP